MGDIFYLLIVILIIRLLWNAYSPNVKGWIGEKAVADILAKLPNDQYKIINNLMIKTENDSTQIDHVVVSKYGIFVIETKNYKGWITGGEYSDNWTKNMYGKKYQFFNPLKQNFGHVKHLAKIINLPIDIFIPIVAFSSRSELKVQTDKPLIYISKVKKVIETYSDLRLSEYDVEEIYNQLLSLNIVDKEVKKAHVANIYRNTEEIKNKVRSGICPKCGSKLVQRTGKYGQFMGCSGYPKCRYIMK